MPVRQNGHSFVAGAAGAGAGFSCTRVTSRTIKNTAAAAQPGDPVSLARATNAISGVMADFCAIYEPTVPAPILELDYLGRELVLDGMSSDFTSANKDLDALVKTWQGLLEKVLNAGGKKAADDYEASLTQLDYVISAQDANAVVAAAKTNLDLVDELENVFK